MKRRSKKKATKMAHGKIAVTKKSDLAQNSKKKASKMAHGKIAKTKKSDLTQNSSATIAEHSSGSTDIDDGSQTVDATAATLLDVAMKMIPPVRYESCQVCGEVVNTVIYCGTLVCVACKKFFLRYVDDTTCKNAGACDIDIRTRKLCKSCRYKKCLSVGMGLEEEPMEAESVKKQCMTCAVCGDLSNGVHYGVSSCEGCKKFYQRGITEHESYSCKADEKCDINPQTRTVCRYCRFARCTAVGMAHSAILQGRPSRKRRYLEAL